MLTCTCIASLFFHKICIDIYVPGPYVFHVCSVMVISEVYLQCFSQLLWVERPGREQWECTWMSAPARCVTFIGTIPRFRRQAVEVCGDRRHCQEARATAIEANYHPPGRGDIQLTPGHPRSQNRLAQNLPCRGQGHHEIFPEGPTAAGGESGRA